MSTIQGCSIKLCQYSADVRMWSHYVFHGLREVCCRTLGAHVLLLCCISLTEMMTPMKRLVKTKWPRKMNTMVKNWLPVYPLEVRLSWRSVQPSACVGGGCQCFMHVCVCTCMYVYVCVCMCMYVLYVYVGDSCMHVCVCVCMYMCVCVVRYSTVQLTVCATLSILIHANHMHTMPYTTPHKQSVHSSYRDKGKQ